MIFTDLPGWLEEDCFKLWFWGCLFFYRLYKPSGCAQKAVVSHKHARKPQWSWKITTREWCTWLRQNFEHCAQRRTLVDFEVSNPPEIALVSLIWLFRDFSKIQDFHENYEIFITMWLTLPPFKLFPTNFLEALPFRIWNYMTLPGAGQKEIQIWRLDPEKSSFFQNFRTNSSRPWFSQICPAA